MSSHTGDSHRSDIGPLTHTGSETPFVLSHKSIVQNQNLFTHACSMALRMNQNLFDQDR